MIWLAWFVIFFLALRIMVVLFNIISRQWLKKHEPTGNPKVSVLIPARNEEKNIGNILQNLLEHDYENIEVLVYDDLSEDRTPKIVNDFHRQDKRIRLVEGKYLPTGWLGKNHACFQLAQEAKGDYFLFIDADVVVEKGLIKNTIGHVQKHRLALLSIFPRQIMLTLSERLIVPLMNWILVGLLPLLLTRVSPWPSFSAANGQFMLFDADTYKKHQFHEALKNQKVEDIAIFRYMKKKKLRVHTVLSNGQVKCRMYENFREATQGFSKNVFEFFGGSVAVAILFALITTFGVVPVYLAMGLWPALAFLVSGWFNRLLISLVSWQHPFRNALLAPLQQASFLLIIFVALRNRIFKSNLWKGRNVDNV